jgi:hypothetical protein
MALQIIYEKGTMNKIMNIKLTVKQAKVLTDCIESSLGSTSKSSHSIQTFRSLEKKQLGKVVYGLFFYINDTGRSLINSTEE